MMGFHLIELLVVLTIISILSLISLPIYSQYLVQAHRLEAITTLSKLAIAMEDYHIQHHTYRGVTLADLGFSDTTGKQDYQLRIKNIADENFLLLASPLSNQ